MSENEIELIAKSNPGLLLEMINNNKLSDVELTFVCEHLGRNNSEERVIDTLISLLNHEKSYVREGVLLGLSKDLDNEKVRKCFEHVSINDPSQIIREIATEMLEDDF